ncbi:AMP-binding protein [Zooshikella ganghwensis]|uniref:D-alanine--poly(Phosphoribitol) ligase n=1 Tax=Zooshikella ganghwensis TaxID=202772 RepID=A0A4P9VQQ6_9GAMM|nr:AMP-binding protein [Zooshikella ganghwensis]RDH45366.1 D-alanine--poly(phosphoribitol) ligase [Zooshikella ganghwensis]
MDTHKFCSVIDYLRFSAQHFANNDAFVGVDEITYQEFYLNVRTLAGCFKIHGVGKAERVAIWLPKCGEYPLAIYAAMEVGAVYVPMDGSQPLDRACKILEKSEPVVLVTDCARFEALDHDFPPSIQLIILIDADLNFEIEANYPAAVIPLLRLPYMGTPLPEPVSCYEQDLAAILFTSGSTGMPKGVKISHGNLHYFVDWAVSTFQISCNDVFANHAGFHFDLSTFDLFAAAAVGGAVWLIRDDEQRNVNALIQGIEQFNISVWYSVPSVLILLNNAQFDMHKVMSTMRYVLFAGEVFPIKHLRELECYLPDGCALFNLYGPTETNVCLYYQVEKSVLQGNKPVYIGQPLPGSTIEIIDEKGQAVISEGCVGELLVTGPCVTPGYWRHYDSVNSLNHSKGIHATGDLVCYERGLLTYLGRKDRMIKLNGNRVELGEIESAISSMQEVKEVAVIAELTESSQHIVAYCSLTNIKNKITSIAVKQYCAQKIPRYMIPKFIRLLPELPKNANGKIDYIALKALSSKNQHKVINNNASKAEEVS